MSAYGISGQANNGCWVVLVKVGVNRVVAEGVAVVVGEVGGGYIGGGECGGVHCHNVTSGNALAVFVLFQCVKVEGENSIHTVSFLSVGW